ncbi:unnamed protein product [Kuraishia capsulata CBS 1993]|uniref:Protein kinase domain-containing protein n=1 Tax=Kuraishia capsulata CBS 1993 TaxID=1382522 RepID=W6MJP3_9ASCO|nr:uncharacterized protein KUCA_T00002738001 [Kuraishia capsulata CBS 1993]CDK26764.1 unnamed protein product [Kuraishia capsulata CBS 1993]
MPVPPPTLRPPMSIHKRRTRPKLPTLSIPTPPVLSAPLTSQDSQSARPIKIGEQRSGTNSSLGSSSQSTISESTPVSVPNDFDSPVLAMSTLSIGDDRKAELEAVCKKDIHELDADDWKLLSKSNEIEELELIGEGNGGSVKKCNWKSKNQIFALKTITTDPNPNVQTQIMRELNFNRSCKSKYIVDYYGTFMDEEDASIYICMEFMGGTSLDAIYKNIKSRNGRIGEKVIGKIAESVLQGLSYLHSRKIIHRDVKPQNILLDWDGSVKLCDFGVSGEVVNSLATTFTGTSYYMAPERIKNEPYTVSSDVWSLGLTLLEVAQGKFPFHNTDRTMALTPIELLSMILEFTPVLNDEPEEGITWSASFRNFLEYCLIKEPERRPSPRQMLEHPWIGGQVKKVVKMDKFVRKCWETN